MKIFRNKKGSVLVMTSAFALVFTMLGIAAIDLSGAQNQRSTKDILSTQAFWIAESALAQSKNGLPDTNLQQPLPNMGNGTYSITTTQPSLYTWFVTGRGTINNDITRAIQATYAGHSVSNIITARYTTTVQQQCALLSFATCTNIKHDPTLSFAEVFHGANIDSITQELTDPTELLNGTLARGTKLKLTTNNQTIKLAGKGLLVIDASDINSSFNPVVLNISGNYAFPYSTFEGIVWVKGNVSLKFAGNLNIKGAIFSEGDSFSISKGANPGSLNFTFDLTAVDNAITSSSIGNSLTRRMTAWKEIL